MALLSQNEMVGDVRRRRKLAEQLRGQEKALSSAVGEFDTSPIVTPGAGAFPGMVQANWAGPLAKLGTAFFAGKARDEAAAEELGAEEARQQALSSVLGNMGNRPPTVSEAMQLQELGLDSGIIKNFLPKAPSVGAVTQAAQTPQGIAALVEMGVWTKEQGDRALAAIKEQQAADRAAAEEAYLFEQRNKTFAPQIPRGMTELEFYQTDPEGYQAWLETKEAAKPAKPTVYEDAAQREQAKTDVKVTQGLEKLTMASSRADKLLEKYTTKPYTKGAKYRALDMAGSMLPGDQKLSSFDPEVQEMLQDSKQFHLDAMEQMRGFGQVTESEQKIIEATQFDIYDSPQALLKKIDTIRGALRSGLSKVQAAKARLEAVPGLGGSSYSEDDEIEAFMAEDE